MFKFIIEELTSGITIINQKGVIISWNKAMENITGIKQKQVLHRYIWDIQYSFAPKEIKDTAFYNCIKDKMKNALSKGGAQWLNKTSEFEIMDVNNIYKHVENISFRPPSPKTRAVPRYPAPA